MNRDDQRRRVEEALARTHRVTLTGEPGVGKSHLARSLGAPLIACGEVRDEAGLHRCIAAFFDRSDESRDAVVREIASLPRVVLDDVDRVPVVALEDLARRVPDTELVWTSRARLALPDEHIVELHALDTEAALVLFDELARRVRDRAIEPDEREDARAIVDAIGGNPAAIELAASRLRVLGPRALRHRLDEPLRLLRDPRAGTSLETMIAWSWDALSDSQRETLAALAVFDDTFGIDDAEAVLGHDALDVIAELRDRSLLTTAGEGALRLPRTVRAFARARVDALPRARLARLLAARLEEPTIGALDRDVFALLQHVADAEIVEHELASAVVEMAIAATPRVVHRGPRSAFLRVLEPVLEVSVRSGAPAALQARAFLARARVQHDGSAERDILAAASIAEKLDDDTLKTAARVALAELRADATLLPEARPADATSHRWDWVRAQHAADLDAARRLAESETPFLAARACAVLARAGDAETHWRRAMELADRDRDDLFRAEALRALLELGALRPEEIREALSWADEAQLDELADALRAEHPSTDVLRIDSKGFTLGSLHVSLERRHALRRIVHALGTGETLDWTALLDAGWPGEQVRAESGAHRVRVAISTLRKLGLSPLLTVEAGYRLDPKIPIDIEL